MNWIRKEFKVDSILSINEFEEWYLQHNHTKFDVSKITTMDTAPINDENASFTQKISYFETKIRNINIVKTIANTLNEYNKVLIVYGSGHHAEQKKVLEAMLGKPIIQH